MSIDIPKHAWKEISKEITQIKRKLKVLENPGVRFARRHGFEDFTALELAELSKEFYSHLDTLLDSFKAKKPGELEYNLMELHDFANEFDIQFKQEIDNILSFLDCTFNDKIREIFIEKKPEIVIPELILPIQQNLIDIIRIKPSEIFEISPRNFEELIADLFFRHGFKVELTKQTRDGGRDIIAISEVMGIKSTHFIECKRNAKHRKVGVGMVRSLYGTVIDARVNKGILVTSSSFARNARIFAENNMHLLELKDYDDIMMWVNASKNKK